MMEAKLYQSELKVMEVLWEQGPLRAGQMAKILKEKTGWNRNTTYTIIKKCIEKGAICRSDPGFLCTPSLSKSQVQLQEADDLIGRLFDGRPELLFSAFLQEDRLSPQEIERLKAMVEDLK